MSIDHGDERTWLSFDGECPICKHRGWCQRSADGEVAMCRREPNGAFKNAVDDAGANYYLHRLKEPLEPSNSPTRNGGTKGATLASVMERDQVYTALLHALPLSESHRHALIGRGLSLDEIGRRGYGALAPKRGAKVAGDLERKFGRKLLLAVPGFFTGDRGELLLACLPGILIPARDIEGRILALKVRPDRKLSNGCKYVWLSSSKRGGAGPGSPVHVPLGVTAPAAVVRLTEGELKSDIATILSGVPTVGAPGVGNWRGAVPILRSLACSTVRLAFDADSWHTPEVARALIQCSRALAADGFSVELERWSSSDGKGIDDVLAGGKPIEVIAGAAMASALAEAADSAGVDASEPAIATTRPTVAISHLEHEVTDRVVDAIASDPLVFQRANSLVTVLRDSSPSKTIDRVAGSPRIATLTTPNVRELITRNAALVVRRRDQSGEWLDVPCHPPEWLSPAVAARRSWPGIRHLEQIAETPLLLPGGTILEKPGYDGKTGILYEPNGRFPAVPGRPTLDDAQAALRVIFEAVTDFPFAGPAHRAAWVAALLTPLARPAIKGPTPLFHFDANCPGSGKTLLADLIGITATSRKLPRTVFSESDDEMRKRITAVALAGDRLMLIDNVAGTFGGSSIDAALTADTWRDRILSKSEMTPEIPLIAVWFSTGNNTSFRGDILRRIVPVRLEAKEDRPEERTGFSHPRLVEWAQAERPRLVVAALTMLRAHFVAGRPEMGLAPLGGFESWSDVVRSAVAWTLDIDPCETRTDLVESDPETQTRSALVEGWAELPGAERGVTAHEALGMLKADSTRFATLRSVMMEWSRTSDLPSAKSVGNRLRALKGRVINGKALKDVPLRAGARAWKVVKASADGGSDCSGDSLPLLRGYENHVHHGDLYVNTQVQGIGTKATGATEVTDDIDWTQN